MAKTSLIVLMLGLCGACSIEQAPPPDPDDVERLLVRLESQSHDPVEQLSGKTRAKVERAERLVAPLEKVQADKVDPNLALALIN